MFFAKNVRKVCQKSFCNKLQKFWSSITFFMFCPIGDRIKSLTILMYIVHNWVQIAIWDFILPNIYFIVISPLIFIKNCFILLLDFSCDSRSQAVLYEVNYKHMRSVPYELAIRIDTSKRLVSLRLLKRFKEQLKKFRGLLNLKTT